MSTVALSRVALVNPLGSGAGDREVQGMSTLINSDEWMIEADYHHGSISDVSLYRNTNVNIKNIAPNWEWYAGIPTANIKSYRLAGDMPKPTTWMPNAEPQAEAKTTVAAGSARAARA